MWGSAWVKQKGTTGDEFSSSYFPHSTPSPPQGRIESLSDSIKSDVEIDKNSVLSMSWAVRILATSDVLVAATDAFSVVAASSEKFRPVVLR